MGDELIIDWLCELGEVCCHFYHHINEILNPAQDSQSFIFLR